MFCSGEAGTSNVEERLRTYVDERVEQLRDELLGVVLEQCKVAGSESEAASPAEKRPSAVPAATLSAEHLDQQDVVAVGCSIWDGVMLIGLDCIGSGESVVMAALLLINYIVQVYFCLIVLLGGMADHPVNDEVLDELLRFRTRVAHKAEYADLVSGRSLLSQVCSGEERLHISGSQRRMHEDFESFWNTGRFLVVLALLCWSASALSEINSALRFGVAIWERRGASTHITLQPGGGYLLESLRSLDVAKVFLFSVLPRLAIACLLYHVGVLYLSRTSRAEDLLLNAMALAFIMDVDELLFESLGPHRVKSLIRGLAPLHLTPLSSMFQKRLLRANKIFGGSIRALIRLLVLLCALVLLYVVELRPFHLRLLQATDILCSGQQDFVYSLNPASGMVVASRSAADESWGAAECTILQLAKPRLRDDLGWSPPGAHCSSIPDLTRLGQSANPASALLRPNGVKALEDAEFGWADFDYVSSLGKADVLHATRDSICVDQVTTQHNGSAIFLTALQDAVGAGLVVSSCMDVRAFCRFRNMTRVRALCPQTCECNLWGFTASGVFKTAYYGCPEQCRVEAVISERRWTASGIYPLECKDFTRTRHYVPPTADPSDGELDVRLRLNLIDSDSDGNITGAEVNLAYLDHVFLDDFWRDLYHFDLNADGVWDASEQSSLETAYSYMTSLDSDGDGSLSSAEAGSIGQDPTFAAYEDMDGDGLLTIAEMSGQPRKVVPPVPNRVSSPGFNVAEIYITTLFEYLWSRPNFNQKLEQTVALLGNLVNLTQQQQVQVFHYLTNPGAADEWKHGLWILGQNVPHPRGLVWCEFIVSWEIVLLLGIDLCHPSDVASVRTFCPQSCRCRASMEDCPASCT